MVGHDDGRALHLEVLQSFHLKPQAEEVLEGLDYGFDDPGEEKREEESGQTAAGQGCNGVCCTVLHQKGWKEVRIVFQPASSLICPWFT